MKDIHAAEDGEEEFHCESEKSFENTGWSRIKGKDADLFRDPRGELPKVDLPPKITKADQRHELNRLVDEYLAKGGKITKCPPGRPFVLARYRSMRWNAPPDPVSRDSTNVALCASDLARRRWRCPILSADEERDFIRAARSDDGERAKQRLVETHHRQVLKIAGEYFGPPHNDRVAAGLLGFARRLSASISRATAGGYRPMPNIGFGKK
jgi:hypothetical protein